MYMYELIQYYKSVFEYFIWISNDFHICISQYYFARMFFIRKLEQLSYIFAYISCIYHWINSYFVTSMCKQC